VPPSLTIPHFTRFDEDLAELTLELLSLPGRPGLPCGEERLSTFKQRLRLPTRFNGAGLLGVDGIGPAAFVGSVIGSCHANPGLSDHIAGLRRFANPVINLLRDRLAVLGDEVVNSILRQPLDDPVHLFDPARYMEYDEETKEAMIPKMQQVWSRQIHKAAVLRLRPQEEKLSDCDFVATHAHARPVSLLLNLLSNPFYRFAPAAFIAWFRFQFRIPQLVRHGNANTQGVEQCTAGCRTLDLDLHGNHAHSGKCKATLAGRGLRHKLQKNVVSYHAAKAGCIASWVTEDSTPELLMHEFSAQECSTMFPTRATASLAQQSLQLRDDLRAAAKLPPTERENKLRELKPRFEPLFQSVKKGKRLRIDGTILHPSLRPQERWSGTIQPQSTLPVRST
jgi:hypothetical protein